MPSVISPQKNFAFLHVPKTGGTTFGQQIAAQIPHDERFVEGIERHASLGDTYRDHLTMEMYAESYPEVFEALRTSDVFAICRDPFGRFKSALAQYARNQKMGELSQIPPDQLEAYVRDILSKLSDGKRNDLNMVFFRPQAEFITYGTDLIATHLFDISALDQFGEVMQRDYGIHLDTEKRERATPHYDRSKFQRVAALKNLAAAILPERAFRLAKDKVKHMIARPDDPELSAILTKLNVPEFVRETYARDYDLIQTHAIRASGKART